MSQLEELLQQCTVKLTLFKQSWGTGFFVAPEWILTCAHVVQKIEGESIQVRWQNQENWAQAIVERSLPEPYDLALLRVTLPTNANPSCVYLDATAHSRDPLYLFGYPDRDFPNGCPVTFSCEGLTGDEPPLIKFAVGQVRPGMSGSPLLNQRTSKVCGIVKFTRDRSTDLGGGAVPVSVIFEKLPELRELQQQFHQGDRRWSDLAIQLSHSADPHQTSSTPAPMVQTNSDGTNYQTQTAPNSTNIIGGTHYHNSNSPQAEPTVKKILILLANPKNPETPHRSKEVRAIREALKRARQGDSFELEDRPDIEASELSQELATVEPYIVNISGDEDGIDKLIFETESGNITLQKPEEVIAQFFKHYAQSIKCIILNGCYSDKQAKELVQNIDFIIGISRKLESSKTNKFLGEFYYQLGVGRSIKDSYDLGCSLLQRTTKCDKTQLPMFLDRAKEERRKALEENLSSSDKDLEKDQENVKLWQKKAGLLKRLGRSEEADAAFERASSIEPNNYKIRTKQGDALEELGELGKAIDAYNKALDLNETDYKVWWKKGKTHVEAQEYDEARDSYRRALLLHPPSPDNYVIWRECGSILEKLENLGASVFSYKNSLKLEPKHRVSSYEKRQVYKKMYSRRK